MTANSISVNGCQPHALAHVPPFHAISITEKTRGLRGRDLCRWPAQHAVRPRCSAGIPEAIALLAEGNMEGPVECGVSGSASAGGAIFSGQSCSARASFGEGGAALAILHMAHAAGEFT